MRDNITVKMCGIQENLFIYFETIKSGFTLFFLYKKKITIGINYNHYKFFYYIFLNMLYNINTYKP